MAGLSGLKHTGTSDEEDEVDVSGSEKGIDKAEDADDIEGEVGSASASATTMPGREVEWRSGMIEFGMCCKL